MLPLVFLRFVMSSFSTWAVRPFRRRSPSKRANFRPFRWRSRHSQICTVASLARFFWTCAELVKSNVKACMASEQYNAAFRSEVWLALWTLKTSPCQRGNWHVDGVDLSWREGVVRLGTFPTTPLNVSSHERVLCLALQINVAACAWTFRKKPWWDDLCQELLSACKPYRFQSVRTIQLSRSLPITRFVSAGSATASSSIGWKPANVTTLSLLDGRWLCGWDNSAAAGKFR